MIDEIVERLRAAGCVYAEDEAALLVEEAEGADELEAMVARRVGGEPLEYVLGWVEFSGLRIIVEPGVFVPRRRTKVLVNEAGRLARPGACLLYTSDAADDLLCVDLGGRRNIKKKKKTKYEHACYASDTRAQTPSHESNTAAYPASPP